LWEVGFPGEGIWARCRSAIITCLHRLSCQICLPPPEIPDAFRLLVAAGLYGGAGTACAATGRLGFGVSLYVSLGLARIFQKRWLLLVVVVLVGLLNWLLMHSAGPVPYVFPALLVAVSELCWVRTMQKVLDEWFESFVALMFFYLGTVMVFAFYPALLRFGPEIVSSSASTFNSAVSDAEGSGGGNSLPRFGSEDDPSGLLALTGVVPLIAIVVGVPLLSVVILIYCWMCHHMSRMVLEVVLTFFAWVLVYASLAYMKVPFNRDLFGKGLLVSVCIVMYSAFGRLATFDADEAQKRKKLVAAGFWIALLTDFCFGAEEAEICVPTLFVMLCACKVAYASCENYIDANQGTEFELSLLSPLRPCPKRRQADLTSVDPVPLQADASDAPSSSYEMLEAAAAARFNTST